ncbi:MAG: ABC transporter permease [Dehalococcoidia bacterium]
MEGAAVAAPVSGQFFRPQDTPLSVIWKFVRRKPLGAAGLIVVLILTVIGAFAPAMQRYDPETTLVIENPNYDPNSFETEAFSPVIPNLKGDPSTTNWLGTDVGGRDTWARLVWGARRSMGVGVGALVIATVVGTMLGVISAYFGGLLDTTLQRLLDAIQAFPPLLLLILIASTRPPSITNLILALGFIGITQVSRIVRGTVLVTRELPYVEAAKVIGANDLRTMIVHILPNVTAPIIVIFTIGLATVIVAEASLSFLAVAPPGASWGEMLSNGRGVITQTPYIALFSGAAISLAVLGFNLAGDALRDVLDPRLRNRAQ